MRITYARFKNFAGIYAGLGRYELELDFSKSTSRMVMLLGDNGTGKTVILSLLSPYRDTTNDKRKQYILEEKKGEKEVHFVQGKDIYVVKHYYAEIVEGKVKNSSGNKSYIAKNGVELNENGGIRTFEQILKEEFSLTKDYFTVGRLGSNVTGFINLSTSERKTFMNRFMPDIDEYLEAFEIVNEKFKNATATIKSIRGQLDKLDDKENLEELERNLITSIDSLRAEKEKIQIVINKSEGKIEDLLLGNNEEDYAIYFRNLEAQLNALKHNLEINEKNLVAIFAKYPNLKGYDDERIVSVSEEYNKGINDAENEIKYENQKVTDIREKNISLMNEKSSKEKFINNSSVDIDYIRSNIESQEKEIEEGEKFIASSQYVEVDMSIDEVNTQKYNMNKVIDAITAIKSENDDDLIQETKPSDREKVLKIRKLEEEDEALRQRRDAILKQINTIEANSYLLETLEQRPAECFIDTCPFIVRALDYKNNEYSLLENLQMNLQEIEEKLPLINKEIEELRILEEFFFGLDKMEKLLNDDFILWKLDLGEITMHEVFQLIQSSITRISETFNIDELSKVVNLRSSIANSREKLESLNEHLQLAVSQEDIIKQTQSEIDAILINIDENNERIIRIEENLESAKKRLAQNTAKLKIVKMVKDCRTARDKAEKEYLEKEMDYNKIYQTNVTIKSEREKINSNLLLIQGKEREIKPLETKLKEVQRDLVLVNNNVERLKEIEENYENYRLVKEALDPKKGIPLFFIDNYLKDIAIRANNLLDIAYGEQFKIKFDINSSDFYINVLKSDGTKLKDIEEGSQGEQSLTTTSLSFGMVEKMMRDTTYNIMYIDEVDGVLSSNNRRTFMNILERQFDEMGVEQAFVISHNKEFDSQPVDLILLKNADVDIEDKEFMENKNIIFQY
jgi:DNA repair exonuclease SbcCD ATPase subunit